MGLQMWKNSKITKKAARIVSASKYNAHTEPLFNNLKLLKIEHILKLHELKLYYKFIHIRLPVYLHNLKLDQNSNIHNINTRVGSIRTQLSTSTRIGPRIMRQWRRSESETLDDSNF